MNRLQSLFVRKSNNILSVFLTAGFPERDSTIEIIEELNRQGVDMVEIGVPFSDPMADGTVIQHSSSVALRNGMTLAKLFEQVDEARKKVPEMPFVLMGYLNPMLKYGIENVFSKCSEVGIDAIIIPDLPFAEYMREYKPLCEKYGIDLIMLITPETSNERIHLIDDNCSGFIYMVSTASTTGTKDRFTPQQVDYFRRIAAMKLRHPRLIGFGISNPATMTDACANSSGAIIGSLFIKCIERNPTIHAAVTDLRTTLGVSK
ncbi:MAG: tryptophan synthase subunit alpha [Paramuribaculum sp.]|nr:tryptophan synthase subunit alpha [Paramuribaculum sp.]